MDKHQLALGFDFKQLEQRPPEEAQLPAVLAHSPFFKPLLARKKADTQGFDDVDGESFRFGHIEWIRFGPGMDTFDLATLVALIQNIGVSAKAPRRTFEAIEMALTDGHKRSSPKSLADIGVDDDVLIRGEEQVTKRFGVTTATTLNRYIGRGTDKKQIDGTRKSIKRLAQQSNTIINHNTGLRREQVKFFSMTTNKSGAMVISFDPDMNFLLHNLEDFDLTIYQNLTPVGQVMMLWMSIFEKRKKHQMPLEEARSRSLFNGELKEYKRALTTGQPKKNVKPVLDAMVELGFLSSAEIIGTGRKTPFQLIFRKK